MIALFFLMARHYYKYLWKNKYIGELQQSHDKLFKFYNEAIMGKINPMEDAHVQVIKRKRLLTPGFFMEAIILLIFPYPFLEMVIDIEVMTPTGESTDTVMYQLCDFMIVIMFLRLFFLVRSIFNYSIYADAYSKKLC